ncbi:MAG: 2-C-methyl-D-erythritol 2,4-cyclodiphosphate synthase [Clostridiales bacterium]|nr:2-C-methyl-D-erythritol 2,4-cyclodiphosphate synthase [Clostridiales bacterium]
MNAAVIVAAGRGSRMGLNRNKVLYPLCGEPIVVRTVRAFVDSGLFDGGVVVVTGADDIAEMKRMLEEAGVNVRAVVRGGADRQASVYCGIRACDENADIIAIHDGARPLVTREVIERTIDSAKRYGSGVAAVMLKDTIKRVDESSCVIDTPIRDTLRAVQTPQTFDAKLIRQAHARFENGNDAGLRATDDAMLAEWMGHTVHLTDGDVENIKLTTPEDMLLAGEVLVRRGEAKKEGGIMRIGHGYDVHRLVEGRKLILCGVEIPHTVGLLGHSDADVAYHALTDALLGAAAMGDIGRHFPDTDPAYKGADSGKLLDHVMELIWKKGYVVGNVDVTIIAQKPKLKDHIEQMRANIAAHLKIDPDCVNVKATTTEKLGFEGEMLGISTHAVACIERE